MSDSQQKLKRRAKPGRPSQYEYMKDWDLPTAFRKTLEDIIELTDEDGRPISELFMELPLRKEYPDYYEEILCPISIKRIKKKVDRQQYPTWADFVQDWVLLSSNAQLYNEPGSQVYLDSQSIQRFIERRTKHVVKIPAIIGTSLSEPEDEPVTPRAPKKPRKETPPINDMQSLKSEVEHDEPAPKSERVILRIPATSSADRSVKARRSKKFHTLTTKANGDDSPGSVVSGSVDSQAEPQPQRGRKKKASGVDSNGPPKDHDGLFSMFENQDLSREAHQFMTCLDPNELSEFELDGAIVKWSLLHCAAFYGRMDAVQGLISNGAQLELRDATFGSTALGWAAFGGRYETCKYLVVECKADRNARNKFSMSPLDLCPHADEKKWKFLFTVSSTEDPSRLTSNLRSRLRSNGKLLRGLVVKLTEYTVDGATEPLAAPLMELPLLRDEPEYYESIINPLSFSLISIRSRAYRNLSLLDDHVGRVFSNAVSYYPRSHATHRAALELKRVYETMRSELLASSHGDALQQLNEATEGSTIPTLFYNGTLFGIGDYTLIRGGQMKKDLDILLLTEIIDEDGEWFASGLGFKFREQIPEAAQFQFQHNEVFKVGNKFKVPFSELASKCCVISFKAFSKNSVENFPPESIFLCEFRYLPDGGEKFQTIKDWSKTVCSFPFFTINTKERTEALCFVRPPFSDFDPHMVAGKKNNKKVIMVPSQVTASPPPQHNLASHVLEAASPPPAAAAEPYLPTSEVPCLDWEPQQAQTDSEASVLMHTIEVEAASFEEQSIASSQKFRFAVDEDFFSMTVGSDISCAFIVPSRSTVDPEFSVKFRLISNNQELAPVSTQIPKFMFPLQPGLNVARIQATLALLDPTIYREFDAPPSQNVTLIFHRLT